MTAKNQPHRMSKGVLKRLKRQGRNACRLPMCRKEFELDDEVVLIGRHFFHLVCGERAFADWDEKSDEADGEEAK